MGFCWWKRTLTKNLASRKGTLSSWKQCWLWKVWCSCKDTCLFCRACGEVRRAREQSVVPVSKALYTSTPLWIHQVALQQYTVGSKHGFSTSYQKTKPKQSLVPIVNGSLCFSLSLRRDSSADYVCWNRILNIHFLYWADNRPIINSRYDVMIM